MNDNVLIRRPGDMQSFGRVATSHPATADILARMLPGIDREAINRAAVLPGMTGNWPAPLVAPILAAFVSGLAHESAALPLMQQGENYDLTNATAVNIPVNTTRPAVAWMTEGSAIPMTSFAIGMRTMTARRLAALIVATRELAARSGFDVIAAGRLTEAAAYALDSRFFSAAAEDSGPAGVYNATNATTGTPDGGTGASAAKADVSNLYAGLFAATINTNGASWAMSPAMIGRLYALGAFASLETTGLLMGLPIVRAATQDPKTLGLIAPRCLAWDVGTPVVDATEDGSVVFDDAPSSDIGGATVGVHSLFQTDMLSFRLNARAAWRTTTTAAVRVAAAVTW